MLPGRFRIGGIGHNVDYATLPQFNASIRCAGRAIAAPASGWVPFSRMGRAKREKCGGAVWYHTLIHIKIFCENF